MRSPNPLAEATPDELIRGYRYSRSAVLDGMLSPSHLMHAEVEYARRLARVPLVGLVQMRERVALGGVAARGLSAAAGGGGHRAAGRVFL